MNAWVHPDTIRVSWDKRHDKRPAHRDHHRLTVSLGIKILKEMRDAGQLTEGHRLCIQRAYDM